MVLNRGYIQIYTGNGKGKTTAALGLALRAAGAGLKVFFAQFLKGGSEVYSELYSLRRFPDLIVVKQYGRGCLIYEEPTDEDRKLATVALEEIERVMLTLNFDLIILDEITVACSLSLIDEEKLFSFLKRKPPTVEVVLTGRYASARMVEMADLVTEMVEIKHYYQRGISAREGIER